MPRSSFLDFLFFSPVPWIGIYLYGEVYAVGSQAHREKGKEGKVIREPVAHQLTIEASCPGLTPFHTHSPGCITALIARAVRANAVRRLSLHWLLLLPGATDPGHPLQIRSLARGHSLFGVQLNLSLPYFPRSCSLPGKWLWCHSYDTFPSHLPLPHPPLAQISDCRRETSCRHWAGLHCIFSQQGTRQIPDGVFQTERLSCASARFKLRHAETNISTVSSAPDCSYLPLTKISPQN